MAHQSSVHESSSQKLEQLRSLLLEEQLRMQDEMRNKLDSLEQEIVDPEKLESHLSPHFEQHLSFLQENFPKLFQKSLSKALEKQVAESSDGIINALYPIIGKMISRYIKNELEKLNQRIDDAQKDFFSLQNWKLRVKSFFTGIPYRELVVQNSLVANLEEVFLIDNESGLLLGHHSFNNLMDPDMIAGMLTGIKGFVEHAFQQDSQNLETVEYEKYSIVINTFHSFYIAAAVSGQIFPDFQRRLDKEGLDFLKAVKVGALREVNAAFQQDMSQKLKEHFDGFNQMD